MPTSPDKLKFMGALRQAANTAGDQFPKADALHQVYFDRTYNVGGTNQITEEEAKEMGWTQADVTAGIVFLENLCKLYTNQPAAQGDYRTTVNKLRNDV